MLDIFALERKTTNILKEVRKRMLATTMDNIKDEILECQKMVNDVYCEWPAVLQYSDAINLMNASVVLDGMKKDLEYYTTTTEYRKERHIRMFDDIWSKLPV